MILSRCCYKSSEIQDLHFHLDFYSHPLRLGLFSFVLFLLKLLQSKVDSFMKKTYYYIQKIPNVSSIWKTIPWENLGNGCPGIEYLLYKNVRHLKFFFIWPSHTRRHLFNPLLLSIFQSSYITHYNLQFLRTSVCSFVCTALYTNSLTCGYSFLLFNKVMVYPLTTMTLW